MNAVWEGSGNVIALDVLRAMGKQPSATEAFVAELDGAAGRDERYDAQLDRTKSLFSQAASSPAAAPAIARRLVESMALTLQAQMLLAQAPAPVAEAYLAGRVAPTSRGMEYGTLPPGVDLAALAARA